MTDLGACLRGLLRKDDLLATVCGVGNHGDASSDSDVSRLSSRSDMAAKPRAARVHVPFVGLSCIPRGELV